MPVCPYLVLTGVRLVLSYCAACCSPDLSCGCGSFDPSPFTLGLSVRIFPYQTDRREVVCHLVGRGCGMTQLCVLEANARSPTECGSQGYVLLRLAGHALALWPVSSRPCDCQMSRLGFHRAAWEAIFRHTRVDDTPPSKVITYSKSVVIVNSIKGKGFRKIKAFFFSKATSTTTIT